MPFLVYCTSWRKGESALCRTGVTCVRMCRSATSWSRRERKKKKGSLSFCTENSGPSFLFLSPHSLSLTLRPSLSTAPLHSSRFHSCLIARRCPSPKHTSLIRLHWNSRRHFIVATKRKTREGAHNSFRAMTTNVVKTTTAQGNTTSPSPLFSFDNNNHHTNKPVRPYARLVLTVEHDCFILAPYAPCPSHDNLPEVPPVPSELALNDDVTKAIQVKYRVAPDVPPLTPETEAGESNQENRQSDGSDASPSRVSFVPGTSETTILFVQSQNRYIQLTMFLPVL